MEDCKTANTPIAFRRTEQNNEIKSFNYEENPFRELLRVLMYLAVCTSSDVTYAISYLSQFNNCFKREHWVAAKWILRYLKDIMNHGLIYRKINKSLLFLCDADWANDRTDRRSYTGSIFILLRALLTISWNSESNALLHYHQLKPNT